MPKSSNPKPKPKAKAKAKSDAKKGKGPVVAVAPVVRQPGVERRRNHPQRAKNGYYQIILTQAVPHVGQPGDLVKVRAGFARNYLLPQGMATFATPHYLAMVEKHRERLRKEEDAKRVVLKNLAAQIAHRKVFIQANANEEGHLYGSVNAEQIAAALRADNLPVEAHHVRIEGPLKLIGKYTIPLHLGPEIESEFEVWVVPPNEEPSA
jgi:large subunit ribosomal protein L9